MPGQQRRRVRRGPHQLRQDEHTAQPLHTLTEAEGPGGQVPGQEAEQSGDQPEAGQRARAAARPGHH